MLVRGSSGSGGGGGKYDLIDVSALTANTTFNLNISESTDCIVAITVPASNGVYVYGGTFQAENGTITTLASNNNQQVKLAKNNGNLVISTSLATRAGVALVAYT